MICNFCGSLLEENEVQCPYCGHETEISRQRFSESGTNYESVKEKTKLPDRINMKSIPGLLFIGFAVCLLICIVCLFSVGSIRSEMNTYQQEIVNQLSAMQSKEQQIEESLNGFGRTGESLPGSAQQTAENISGSIDITKQPTDSATYLGRGGNEDNKQDVPIFTVMATGTDLRFTWQRYEDGSQRWVDIIFDENSNNEEMGLKVITDLNNGYSELAAHNVKSIAYGSYRCQISDPTGVRYSDIVVLSQKDNK